MRLPSHRHWFLEDQFPRARHRRPDNRLRQGADRAPAGYRSATFLGRLEAGGDAAVSVLLNPVGRVPQVRHRRAWRQVKSGHGLAVFFPAVVAAILVLAAWPLVASSIVARPVALRVSGARTQFVRSIEDLVTRHFLT